MLPLIIFAREDKTALIFNGNKVQVYHFDQHIRTRIRYKISEG